MGDLYDTNQNTAFVPSPTPAPSTTPSGTPTSGTSDESRQAFVRAVLRGLGISASAANLNMFYAWMQAEGTSARYNPLATTQQAAGASDFNYAGVKNYTSFAQGVAATIQTLRYSRYTGVLAALRGANYQQFASAVGTSGWGTNGNTIAGILGAPMSADYGQGSTVGGGGGNQAPFTGQYGPSGGYKFPFDISRYQSQAAAEADGNQDLYNQILENLIYGSPEFKAYYPGIFRPDGRLRMQVADYDRYVDDITHQAQNAGLRVTRAQVGSMIGMDVSQDEAMFRVTAAQQIKANAAFIPAINDVLQASGFKPITSAQDAFNFFTGRADPTVYSIYEKSSILAASTLAGQGSNLNEINRLARATPGVTTFAQAQDYFEQARQMRNLADPELAQFGITQKDLDDYTFGLANADQKQRVEQAIANRRGTLGALPSGPQLSLAGGRPIEGAPTPVQSQ